MSDINLEVSVEEKYNTHSLRWSGSQGWVGNNVYVPASFEVGARPIIGVAVHLKATNATIPGTSTSNVYLQGRVQGHWFPFPEVYSLNVAGVVYSTIDLYWLRTSTIPTAISDTGSLNYFSPFFNVMGLSASNGPPMTYEALRLALIGSSLSIAGSGTEWLWTEIGLDIHYG